ncbi:MAG TPA: peptidylprolyl isomerase [Desulfomonilia bacterium]
MRKENMVKRLIILLVVLGLAVVGCSKGTEGGKPADQKAVKFSNPHVIAKIGTTEIKDSDLDAILSQIPEPYRERYATPEAKREIIEKMAEVKMMAMEAKKRGIDKKPETKLKLEYIGDQILARDLEESTVENIKISDADITKYYNDNKDKFAQGPRVKVRHILVATEPEAKAILDQLKKGADFAKLAKEKSKCPSAQRGGDLGWVTPGRMDPEFEKAAFALKKGQMSGIVKSSFGYHIIICDDIEAKKEKSLAEVKPQIERQLQREKKEEAVNKMKEQVKKDFPITINEEYFKKAQEEAAKKTKEEAQKAPAAPGTPGESAPGAPAPGPQTSQNAPKTAPQQAQPAK